jgi:hypothetical protein
MYLKHVKALFLSIISITTLLSCVSAQTVEDVLQKFPGENAVILNYNRDTKIFLKDGEPVAETKEETEILVLDDKANGVYNKYKVFHGSFDELKDLEAYTKVPDGNKYRKIKVVDIKTQSSPVSGVFYDDAKESVFDFPSMIKGAIANVSYTEFHKDAHLLSPFYFTSYIPVINARFTVSCASDIQLKYILRNDDEHKIQVKEDKKGRQTIYEFTSNDQKSKGHFGDGPPRSHYEPHVIVHIASYKNDQGQQVNFLGSVEDLYKWNSSFVKQVNTNPSPIIRLLADSLTKGIQTEKDKAWAIYRWVQEHIKYVAFENGLEGFIPRQAADVCTKRYGDCKDMASLLTALLKEAGLKAYFTWIGTRDIPYMYSDVPLPLTDNHMICTVNINGDWIFLDGTDPNCIYGAPSKAIQGKQALVGISDKEYKLLEVPVLPADKNYVVDSTFIAISDNGIKGTSSIYYNGYFGVDAYNRLQYQDNSDMKDYVKAQVTKGSNKFILDDYSINKISSTDKVMNFTASFQLPDYGKKIADEYYINLNLDKSFITSPIDTAKRKVAVDHDFKFRTKNYTVLDVPQGFEVSYVPENFNYKNDLFAVNINYSVKGNKIIAAQEFTSDCMMLNPKDFSKWNETVKEVASQYKKQLVLKKK